MRLVVAADGDEEERVGRVRDRELRVQPQRSRELALRGCPVELPEQVDRAPARHARRRCPGSMASACSAASRARG